MILYLGGKMIGRPGFGFMEFDEAAAALCAIGHSVFNPAERDRSVGFSAEGLAGTYAEVQAQGFDRREALGTDMAWIVAHSQGMIVLPSWTDSPGAKAEVALHQGLYLPVWPLADFLALGTLADPLPPLQPGKKDRRMNVRKLLDDLDRLARRLGASLGRLARRAVVGTLARIQAPAIPPELLKLVAEVGFVTLFLVGFALTLGAPAALMAAGGLGVFAIERNGRGTGK